MGKTESLNRCSGHKPQGQNRESVDSRPSLQTTRLSSIMTSTDSAWIIPVVIFTAGAVVCMGYGIARSMNRQAFDAPHRYPVDAPDSQKRYMQQVRRMNTEAIMWALHGRRQQDVHEDPRWSGNSRQYYRRNDGRNAQGGWMEPTREEEVV